MSQVTFIFKVLANSTETLGVAVLKSRGFLPHAYWYWIGVGAMVGFVLLFNIFFTLAVTYLNRGYHNPFQFSISFLFNLLNLILVQVEETYALVLYK